MRQGRGDKYDLFVYDLPSGEITRLTQNEGDNENPSWSADGRVIVYSSSRDVTERNQTEVALREHDALLNAVMKLLPVGVWVADKQGKIVFGNDSAQKIWGGSRYVGIEQFGEYKGWWLTIGVQRWTAMASN